MTQPMKPSRERRLAAANKAAGVTGTTAAQRKITIDTGKHTLIVNRRQLAQLRVYASVLDRMATQINMLLSDAAHANSDLCDACSLDGDVCHDALAALIDTD